MESNFQHLMLSPNLLKSKLPMSGGGWGRLVETNFQLLMLSPNFLKSKILMSGGGACGNQFPKVNFKFSKSSPELKFPFCVEEGAGRNQFPKVNFKFSKSSPELKFTFSGGVGGGRVGH